MRRLQAPLVTGAVVVLVAIIAFCWGRQGESLRTARIANLRADLADSGCILTADVQLESLWTQLAFARVRADAQRELVAIMRGKRRYMVQNETEREALAVQMADAINHLAQADIAERVDFPRFELF